MERIGVHLIVPKYAAGSERPAYGEAEGGEAFVEGEGLAIGLLGRCVGGLIGEQRAVERQRRRDVFVNAEGIVGEVDAEGGVDDGQQDLEFEAGGGAHELGAGGDVGAAGESGLGKFRVQLGDAVRV